jgi:uncharacterized membrane protein
VSDYPPPGVPDPGAAPTNHRLEMAAAAGIVAAGIVSFLAPWQVAPLLGWAVGASVWVLCTWKVILGLDAMETAAAATREEPHRAQTDLLLLSAAVISLVAVVLGVVKAGDVRGSEKWLLLLSGVFTVIASWGVVHTVFALRYAALYYAGPDGGIDFNEREKPVYQDFAYLAFTIGMTYQVSDTNLHSKPIRHAALRHALLSYVFGTVIIAATINLAASLVK